MIPYQKLKKLSKKSKIALVLNGGVARGFFQIGVLEKLINKYNFEILVGTGIGAFFAALVAAGIEVAQIKKFAHGLEPEDFIKKEKGSDLGFFTNKVFLDFLNMHIGDMAFSQLKKTLAIVTTDIETGKQVVLHSGPILSAVEASLAQPGFNSPVNLKGKNLFDGSILNPLPVDVARSFRSDFVVVVDTVSQHDRLFDEKNTDLTFWTKYLWSALLVPRLLRKKKIPWVAMRVIEIAYTNTIDEIIKKDIPEIFIKLEEQGDLGKEVLEDSFDRILDLIELGEN